MPGPATHLDPQDAAFPRRLRALGARSPGLHVRGTMVEPTRAVAIVGVGAVLPDAPDVATFWQNIQAGRYSISDVKPDRWDPARYFDPDPHAPDSVRWLALDAAYTTGEIVRVDGGRWLA